MGNKSGMFSTGSTERFKNLAIGGVAVVALVGLAGVGLGFWQFPSLSASQPSATGGAQITGGSGTTTPSGACSFPIAQTLTIRSENADQHGTETASVTNYIFSDVAKGTQVSNVTQQNGEYTILSNATGYFGAISKINTGCGPSPQITQYQKQADTAMTMTIYNNGGHTQNTVAANATLGTGGGTTLSLELKPSAKYVHLSGESNKFTVWFSGVQAQNWSANDFTVTSYVGNLVGSGCVRTTQPLPTALTDAGIIGFDCVGDFTGKDQNIYKLDLGIQAAATVNPSDAENMTVSIAGWDHYISVVGSGDIGGILREGAVKNDGSAIHALQQATIHLG